MFELLVNQVKGHIDVLRISKTKIDDSFPLASFLIGGFSKPYRLDRDSSGACILLNIGEDIQSDLLELETNRLKVFI